eukprot:scpid33223/ scgid17241/ 
MKCFRMLITKRKSCWAKVAADIADENRNLKDLPAAENCENRWKSPMRSFQSFIDNQNKTGEERKKEPQYYKEMNEAIGWKPNVQPLCTAGSLPEKRKPVDQAPDDPAAQVPGGNADAADATPAVGASAAVSASGTSNCLIIQKSLTTTS